MSLLTIGKVFSDNVYSFARLRTQNLKFTNKKKKTLKMSENNSNTDQAKQSCKTSVNKSVLLTESDLVDLGFEIVRWKEPNYYVGIDRFYKLDYAIIRINKDSGISDDLVIRFREGKFVLDGYYSVRFFVIQDIKDLISSLTRASQTVC